MPFCPNCRYEYLPEVTTCPDCNETLVAQLPEEEAEDLGPTYENWVPMARMTSKAYVDMVIHALRSEEIPVVVQSEAGFFGATGQMGTSSFQSAGRGYLVMVPEEFAAEADTTAEGVLGEEWAKAKLFDIES